ncbi:VOC family protein [Flavihumibacter sp. R14]|nr:VOC family protein [Flavihumibacter soli]
MSNRVVHFEIPCDDPEKNMKFFSKVFGWTFEQFGNEPYWSVTTGDESKPGINGGLMKKRDPQQPVANSIEVRDIDRAMGQVAAAGGTIVVEKMAVPSIGWLAYFKDPDGNIHGLFQDDPSAIYEPGVQAS